MSSESRAKTKRWQPGDLVLLEQDAKIHRNLLEVLEVRQNRAKTIYLEAHAGPSNTPARQPNSESWHPLEELRDPAQFLRTEEFLRTVQEHSGRKPRV